LADGNVGRELDRADAELDLLIERRQTYLDNEAANARSELWRSSKRRYLSQREVEHREAWLEHHRRRAELFEALAGQHRAALGKLLDDAAIARRRGS